MTTFDIQTPLRRPLTGRRGQVAVLSSVSSALLVRALARAADVDLTVRAGGGVRTVGWASVLVASLVAALAGLALLAVLEARLARGRQVWTGVATGVFLASVLAGPAAATGVAAGIALGAMHAAVWLSLLGSAWWRR